MIEVPIKFNLPDQASIDPYGQTLEHVIITGSGIKLRPGSDDFFSLNDDIDFIYDWEEQERLLVVAGGKVYLTDDVAMEFFTRMATEAGETLITEDGSELIYEPEITTTDVTADSLTVGPVTIANFKDYVFLASGGPIVELHAQTAIVSHGGLTYTCIKNNINIEPGVHVDTATYWTQTGTGGDAWSQYIRYGSGETEELTDADAPTQVSWVAAANKYLLALEDNSERMWYSQVEEPWSFDSEWVSSEFLPDNVSCLQVVDGDVWVGGPRSLQVFHAGTTVAWSPSSYGAITTGILAPRSFIVAGGGFLFVDDTRRLVTLSGRTATSVNATLDSYLASLSEIADAQASYVVLDGIQLYILRLPTEKQTIAVNMDLGSWSVWGDWHVSPTYVQNWDIVVAGVGDEVHYLSKLYGDDNGTAINGLIRTPRITASNRGRVARMDIKLVQTEDAGVGTASIGVRFRDDGKDWSNTRTVTLDSNKTDHICTLRRLGSFKHYRQYEFDVSNIWPFALDRVEHDPTA